MIGRLRNVRVVPIVLIATASLFTLKLLGLAFDGGNTLGDLVPPGIDDTADITGSVTPVKSNSPQAAAPRQEAKQEPQQQPQEASKQASKQPPKQSWAQQMFNYPDVTGSVGEKPAAAEKEKEPAAGGEGKTEAAPKKAAAPPPKAPGTAIPVDGPPIPSVAERAILERLQERRGELDTRERELDTREHLIEAAEKRLEERVASLKALQGSINDSMQKKDAEEAARFKNLVTMYESMKPKDAARIFDRLDGKVLLDVASKITPRQMSQILAEMSAESAEKLTVELAARFGAPAKAATPDALPKIEGKPQGS